MESERFDRWTKRFARRVSRRTAAAGLGAAVLASLAAPRRARGRAGDEDRDADDGGDSGAQDAAPEKGVCLNLEFCEAYICTAFGCGWQTFGDIPGGPYIQEWSWGGPPNNRIGCVPTNHTFDELGALCNRAYPRCNNSCATCAAYSLLGCD
jgi:hypothetical protein